MGGNYSPFKIDNESKSRSCILAILKETSGSCLTLWKKIMKNL
jgi:hypothetical protein